MNGTPLPPKTHYLVILNNLETALRNMQDFAKEHPMLAPHDDIAALEGMIEGHKVNLEQCGNTKEK